MAKLGVECEVCGRAAKKQVTRKGYNLCKKHYNIKIQQESNEKPTPQN